VVVATKALVFCFSVVVVVVVIEIVIEVVA